MHPRDHGLDFEQLGVNHLIEAFLYSLLFWLEIEHQVAGCVVFSVAFSVVSVVVSRYHARFVTVER